MNIERRPISYGGSARLLITFFLGVCVGVSLYHAWLTANAPDQEIIAQNNGPGTTPPLSTPPNDQEADTGSEPEPPVVDPEVEIGDPSPMPGGEEPGEANNEENNAGDEGSGEEGNGDEPIIEPEENGETEVIPEPIELPEESVDVVDDTSYADLEGLWPARHLFVGLPGPELDDETRAWLKEFKPGGVLLRPENIMEDWQVRDLIAEVRAAVGLGDLRTDLPLIAIAQEGGPQANPLRLEDAPSAEALGREAASALAIALAGDSPNLTEAEAAVVTIRETAERYGQYAREQGYAVILGPVLDVFRPGESDPRLRDRTFSTDALRVSVCGRAFHDGVLSSGVIPVVKHYPGLGAAKALPDGTLIIQDSDKDKLAGEIFLPFAYAAEWPATGMLVAPVAVPILDQSGRAASVSPRIVGSLLREKWNFEGVVLAASMENLSTGEAFAGALVAGCDAMVLELADRDALNASGKALAEAVAAGDITEDGLAARRKRLELWQTRIGGTPGRITEDVTEPPVDIENPPEETPGEGEVVSPEETTSTESEVVEPEDTEPGEAESVEPENNETTTPEEGSTGNEEVTNPSEEDEATSSPEGGTPDETATPPDNVESESTEVETGTETTVEPVSETNDENTTGEDNGEEPTVESPEPEDSTPKVSETDPEGDTESDTGGTDVEAPEPEDSGPSEVPAEAGSEEGEPTESGAEPEATPLEPAPQPEGTKLIEHTIRRGDTLNSIARLYRVDVNEIKAWNALEDEKIKFGFKLLVYVSEENYEEILAQDKENFSYYTIQTGDRLKAVAERFGISEEALIQLNGLTNPDHILVGQRLKVPKPEAEPEPEPEPEPEEEPEED